MRSRGRTTGGGEKHGEREIEIEGEREEKEKVEKRGMTSKGERCSRDAARVTKRRGNRCVSETLVGILGTNQ